MKNLQIIVTTGAYALTTAALLCAGTAAAGTIDASTAMPHVSTLSADNKVITVKHIFAVGYYNNEKFSCGARLESSDGTAAKNVTLTQATTAKQVVEERQYKNPGVYKVTLSGFAWGNYKACLGSQTSTTEVKAAPAEVKKPAVDVSKQSFDQGMSPINTKAKLMKVVLNKNEFSPGPTSMYSTIYLDKADKNCLLDFTVTTTNSGTDAINLELMRQNINGLGNGTTASSEFNPGTLNFTSTGKYRVTVRARTEVADNHCTGSVSTDFEVKRIKLFGATAPTPNPTYGSMITKITSVNKPGAWDITVHGSGDKDCKYHVNLWSLPEMSIFKSEAMTYKKYAVATMTIPKPVPGKGVHVEVMQENDDVVDNKGCLGRPTLDLQVALPPKGKTDLGDTIKPKKGLITALTISKKTFTLGETIPAVLKVQGDSCYFIYKIRKLPMTVPDVIFGNVLANPLKVNEMDLNNLGDTLTAGNWEVFMQASQGPLAPGEVSCDIAPGQGTRVLFTVTP